MGEKVKVGVFIRGFHHGGIEKVIETYFSHMDLTPFDIHIITHMQNVPEKKKMFEDMGCTIHELSPMRGHRINRTNIEEYKKLFAENHFDVVHNNMPDFLLPLRFAKKNRVPVRILHTHNLYMEKLSRSSKWKVKLYQQGFIMNARMATDLVALNETTAKATFFSLSDRAHILVNAIEIDKFRFDPQVRAQVREQLGVADDKLLLGHVGRYENDSKYQELVVEIFAGLCKDSDRYRMVMIGDGKRRPSIMDLASRKGVADKITFTGNVYNVQDYFKAMDIFLLPSKQEGLGIVAVEAEATGLPCVVSDRVPKEVKILDSLSFLPIYCDNAAELWIEKVGEIADSLDGSDRVLSADIIAAAGYDITQQAVKLSSIYLSGQ